MASTDDTERTMASTDKTDLKMHPMAKQLRTLIPSKVLLKTHQILGDWVLDENGNFLMLLCDPMGMGKTITTISNIFLHLGPETKIVVICPQIVEENWINEFRKACYNIKGVERRGGVIRRQKEGRKDEIRKLCFPDYDTEKNDQLISMSFEQLQIDKNFQFIVDMVGKDKDNTVLVIDEVHHVNNFESSRSQKILQLRKHFRHVSLLSGTPILNKIKDIASIFILLGRGKAGLPSFWDMGNKSISLKWVKEITSEISKYMVLRPKSVCKDDMVSMIRHHVDLPMSSIQHWACMIEEHEHGLQLHPYQKNGKISLQFRRKLHSTIDTQSKATNILAVGCLYPLVAKMLLIPVVNEEVDEQCGSFVRPRPGSLFTDEKLTALWKTRYKIKGVPPPWFRYIATRKQWELESRREHLRGSCACFNEGGMICPVDRTAMGSADEKKKNDSNNNAFVTIGSVKYEKPSVYAILASSVLCQYFLVGKPNLLAVHLARQEKVIIYMERVDPAIQLVAVFRQFYMQWYKHDLAQEKKDPTVKRIFSSTSAPPTPVVFHGRMHHADRRNALARFKSTSANECPLMVFTKCGSVGANMVEASIVYIEANLGFHLGNILQAETRNYRIGQKKNTIRSVHLRVPTATSDAYLLLQYLKQWMTNQILYQFKEQPGRIFPEALYKNIDAYKIATLVSDTRKHKDAASTIVPTLCPKPVPSKVDTKTDIAGWMKNTDLLQLFSDTKADANLGFLCRCCSLASGPLLCEIEKFQGKPPSCGICTPEKTDGSKHTQKCHFNVPPESPLHETWNNMFSLDTDKTDAEIMQYYLEQSLPCLDIPNQTAETSPSSFPMGIGYPLRCSKAMVDQLQVSAKDPHKHSSKEMDSKNTMSFNEDLEKMLLESVFDIPISMKTKNQNVDSKKKQEDDQNSRSVDINNVIASIRCMQEERCNNTIDGKEKQFPLILHQDDVTMKISNKGLNPILGSTIAQDVVRILDPIFSSRVVDSLTYKRVAIRELKQLVGKRAKTTWVSK